MIAESTQYKYLRRDLYESGGQKETEAPVYYHGALQLPKPSPKKRAKEETQSVAVSRKTFETRSETGAKKTRSLVRSRVQTLVATVGSRAPS